MSIVLMGSTSGSVTLQEPAVAGTTIIDLPATSGTVGLTTGQIGMKNRIINGAMVIDQRNAGASVTPTTSGDWYGADRWIYNLTQSSKFSSQQSSTAPTGFINSILITSLSAYSVAAGDIFALTQHIEGLNVGDLGWGTASAKTVTLSFQVRSSLTGTFGGAIQNSARNRSYPFSYTISTADTWETKTITIAGDTTGTWLTTNGIGVTVRLGLGVGSTYSGTAGAWAASDFRSATGATSVVGTSGATFYITGVQLEVGSQATSFEYRQYQQELALCHRYCYTQRGVNGSRLGFGWTGSTTQASMVITLPVTMRSAPTLTSCTAIAVNDNQQEYSVSNTVLGDGSTATAVYLTVTSTGMTIGRGAQTYFTTSTGLMILNSEL